MMEEAIRIRTARLIRGEANVGDLDLIFSWLRFRSRGDRILADIGDFVCHLEDRERGLTWRGVNLFTHMLRFQLPRIEAYQRYDPPPVKLIEMKESAFAALDMSADESLYEQFGHRKDSLRKKLTTALKAFGQNADGSAYQRYTLSSEKDKIFQYFAKTLHPGPLFTSQEVATRLATALRSNRIIAGGSEPAIIAQEQLIALYVVSKLHMLRIKVNDSIIAELHMGLKHDGCISLDVTIPYSYKEQPIKIAMSIMRTTCVASDCLEGDLLAEALISADAATASLRPSYWAVPIELGANGLIRQLA